MYLGVETRARVFRWGGRGGLGIPLTGSGLAPVMVGVAVQLREGLEQQGTPGGRIPWHPRPALPCVPQQWLTFLPRSLAPL